MYRRKDNLTDLIENLPSSSSDSNVQSSSPQQVIDGSGQIVTLGQKPAGDVSTATNKSSLEPSDLMRAIRVAITQGIDRFVARHKNNHE